MFVHNFIWCIYDFWRGAVDGSQWSHTGAERKRAFRLAQLCAFRGGRSGMECRVQILPEAKNEKEMSW